MITENLSTLKIHKLSQEQYDRELAAGRIDENALYLTPEEEIDLSNYATKDQLKDKASQTDLDEHIDDTNIHITAEEREMWNKVNMQSDWAQNDETAADFVKNRTHWKEIKTGVLIPETSIEFSNAGQPAISPFILEIQEGSTYEVTWNGNVYQCVAYIAVGPNIPSIGNGTITSITGGNDEPFFIASDGVHALVFAEEVGTHTVSISGEATTWHTLDKRYLPTNLATTDDVQSVANDVQTVANNVNKKMNATNPVGAGSFSMNIKAGSTIGSYSHAEGYDTTASEYGSHAEGVRTIASEYGSHAEGANTIASRIGSHAEGIDTTASGGNSHAEGASTTASGGNSHAEGSYTTASGGNSHAEGGYTTASGSNSHAEGASTTASGINQHVQGKFNINDVDADGKALNTYAHIVGNGTSASARSNAHTLDWSGNAWFQGDVYVGGTGQDDEAAERLAKMSDIPSIEGFASESYVDTKLAAIVNSAPETLDTLGELATAMEENESVVNALNQAIANKADNSTVTQLQETVNAKAENSALNEHTTNSTIHITAVERAAWNSKMDGDSELISIADIDAICGSVIPIAEVLF